jgi:ribonuclease P protein component
MLSRAQKLSVAQFDVVMERGGVYHSPLFMLQYTVGNSDTRIAAISPKKITKTASSRNAAKRKIYAAARLVYPSIISGLHAAIVAKATMLKAEQGEIIKDMKELFVKARLLR